MLGSRLHPLACLAVDSALPCPLMVVPDVNGERADAGDSGDAIVAVLERTQTLVIRAAADDVTGAKRRD
jgi:hypothetical protein